MALVLGTATVAPLAGVTATDTTGCNVDTSSTTGDFQMDDERYYSLGVELWQESNGVDGLQRSASWCKGRASIPADTCVTHSETGSLVNCGTRFARAQI